MSLLGRYYHCILYLCVSTIGFQFLNSRVSQRQHIHEAFPRVVVDERYDWFVSSVGQTVGNQLSLVDLECQDSSFHSSDDVIEMARPSVGATRLNSQANSEVISLQRY
jgi:hypothetical protein